MSRLLALALFSACALLVLLPPVDAKKGAKMGKEEATNPDDDDDENDGDEDDEDEDTQNEESGLSDESSSSSESYEEDSKQPSGKQGIIGNVTKGAKGGRKKGSKGKGNGGKMSKKGKTVREEATTRPRKGSGEPMSLGNEEANGKGKKLPTGGPDVSIDEDTSAESGEGTKGSTEKSEIDQSTSANAKGNTVEEEKWSLSSEMGSEEPLPSSSEKKLKNRMRMPKKKGKARTFEGRNNSSSPSGERSEEASEGSKSVEETVTAESKSQMSKEGSQMGTKKPRFVVRVVVKAPAMASGEATTQRPKKYAATAATGEDIKSGSQSYEESKEAVLKSGSQSEEDGNDGSGSGSHEMTSVAPKRKKTYPKDESVGFKPKRKAKQSPNEGETNEADMSPEPKNDSSTSRNTSMGDSEGEDTLKSGSESEKYSDEVSTSGSSSKDKMTSLAPDRRRAKNRNAILKPKRNSEESQEVPKNGSKHPKSKEKTNDTKSSVPEPESDEIADATGDEDTDDDDDDKGNEAQSDMPQTDDEKVGDNNNGTSNCNMYDQRRLMVAYRRALGSMQAQFDRAFRELKRSLDVGPKRDEAMKKKKGMRALTTKDDFDSVTSQLMQFKERRGRKSKGKKASMKSRRQKRNAEDYDNLDLQEVAPRKEPESFRWRINRRQSSI